MRWEYLHEHSGSVQPCSETMSLGLFTEWTKSHVKAGWLYPNEWVLHPLPHGCWPMGDPILSHPCSRLFRSFTWEVRVCVLLLLRSNKILIRCCSQLWYRISSRPKCSWRQTCETLFPPSPWQARNILSQQNNHQANDTKRPPPLSLSLLSPCRGINPICTCCYCGICVCSHGTREKGKFGAMPEHCFLNLWHGTCGPCSDAVAKQWPVSLTEVTCNCRK